MAWELRQDPRVVMERTNIRNVRLEDLPALRKAVIDVSFISLKLVIPAAIRLLENNSPIVSLIKPQFEVERKSREKG